MKFHQSLLATSLLAASIGMAHATDATGKITVRADIVPTACSTVSKTDVDLGQVTPSEVTGGTATPKSFSVDIECTGTTVKVSSLSFNGTASTGNPDSFAVAIGDNGTAPNADSDIAVKLTVNGDQTDTFGTKASDKSVITPNTDLLDSVATDFKHGTYHLKLQAQPVQGKTGGAPVGANHFSTDVTVALTY
ncbi:type 1 fimbrial protein [Pandoraea fibrosis]|uniref:Type 1 fimbrial protein n=1 Tax=Pandoraea fibrosis TaxID=1891094 RepID=A0ABX6HRL5_9BURK|nr:fimbrial protein [Pandoraea fibrosis]QHE92897.1 type 1 fimbrial protein [Pandoraea fibrosis]QHF13546.1 type 1 fimbrial protein [Pandoraea fibrosis]